MSKKDVLDKWNSGDMLPKQQVVSVIIRNKAGDVLTMYHNKIEKITNPVGKVDPGDTVEGTFLKESGEELGIKVEEVDMVGHANNVYARNGTTVKITEYHGVVTKYTGKIRNAEPHKHKDLKFRTLAELRAMPSEKLSTTLRWVLNWLS